MNHPGNISIENYTYNLPADKIALHPLPERDASKLLVYKNQLIEASTFDKIDNYLNERSLLVYNDTRVINARLIFHKESGKKIEIFCLEPVATNNGYQHAMSSTTAVRWKCLVGGAASWKNERLIKKIGAETGSIILEANLVERMQEAYIVEFSWSPAISFAEVLLLAGEVPLPPYIKRKVEQRDSERYQTIYASQQGSVAAPTAGLHFTDAIFDSLDKKNIERLAVTLHVSAGTFKPVTAETMHGHIMHAEWIDVDLAAVKKIAACDNDLVAVGTTSLRTLESLYWLGVKAMATPDTSNLSLQQWDSYELKDDKIQRTAALQALINWMENKGLSRLITTTQLLIAPGYVFRMVNAIVTNFHQPHSTLLLLVAAAIGNKWKDMYQYALDNNFRFLSYGDSNLIFIDHGLMVTEVPTGM